MKNKKILVLLKFAGNELNPFDGAALECALALGAADITVLAMAPASVAEPLRALTRLGVNAVLVSDRVYAGSDTQATARVLEAACRRLAPDLIFCGRQSVDGDTAQVPPMLAERLGYAIFPKVMAITADSVSLRDGRTVNPAPHSILTFERIATLRFPSMFSRPREVLVWDNAALALDTACLGLHGSPTRVVKSYESREGRRECRFVTPDRLPDLIREGLAAELKGSALYTGEKLPCVHYFGALDALAASLGERAVRVDAAGKSPRELADELIAADARAVLFEDTEEYKLLAPAIAVHTGAGLCADCISFRVEEGRLIMTRPARGGNVTADILCTGEMAMATVRTPKKGGAELVFAVGRGALASLDKIRALAERYGAELCCSRPVTDGGVLPYTAQVGLTGRALAPRVYVAFGISGAVQHTCAISGAGCIIALNCDRDADIFTYSDYGILCDIADIKE